MLALLLALQVQVQDLFPAQPKDFLTDLAGKVAVPAEVNEYLRDLQQKDTLQLVAVILPSTKGRPVEDVARAIGRQWRVAQKDSIGSELRNTGGVILLVIDSRQCRVEVARGSEGYMTDSRAADACRTARASFQAGNFGAGIITIAEQFAVRHRTAVLGTVPPEGRVPSPRDSNVLWWILGIGGPLLVIAIFLIRRRRKRDEENRNWEIDRQARWDAYERQRPESARSTPVRSTYVPDPVIVPSQPVIVHHDYSSNYGSSSSSSSSDSGSSSSSSDSSPGGGSDSFSGGGGGDTW